LNSCVASYVATTSWLNYNLCSYLGAVGHNYSISDDCYRFPSSDILGSNGNPTAETSWEPHAVDSDVTKMLAVVTLH
jgi:hypothetical protein